MRSSIRPLAVAFTLFFIVGLTGVLAGCRGQADAPPKAAGDLTDAEKQQVRELQEQRASEWGTAKKK
jgi:hypothetical protein